MANESETFAVAHRELGSETDQPAGMVEIDGEHQITVVSAEEDFADLLDLAADTLNDSDDFTVRAPQPPDAAPLTLHKRAVRRDDPAARDALLEVLGKRYRLFLTPAG